MRCGIWHREGYFTSKYSHLEALLAFLPRLLLLLRLVLLRRAGDLLKISIQHSSELETKQTNKQTKKTKKKKQTHPFSGTSLILLPFSSVSSNFSMAACPRQSWNTLKCMIIVTKIKQHNIETEEKANSQKQNHKKSHTSWTWRRPYPPKDKTQHKTFSSRTSISLLLANSTVPSFLRDLWASANVTFKIFKHIYHCLFVFQERWF